VFTVAVNAEHLSVTLLPSGKLSIKATRRVLEQIKSQKLQAGVYEYFQWLEKPLPDLSRLYEAEEFPEYESSPKAAALHEGWSKALVVFAVTNGWSRADLARFAYEDSKVLGKLWDTEWIDAVLDAAVARQGAMQPQEVLTLCDQQSEHRRDLTLSLMLWEKGSQGG
jgi:hypothetical protein